MIDTNMYCFRELFWQTARLSCREDSNDRFIQETKALIVDLEQLVADGSGTAGQRCYLIGMIRALLNRQEHWLERESAVIEMGVGAVMN